MRILPVQQPRKRADFALTMVNIVFLLLLFFLTTGSLTNPNEAEAELALTSDLPLERLPRPLLLIEEDGTLQLDGSTIPPQELVERARAALAVAGDGVPLSLFAARDMPAHALLGVAERLSAAGIGLQIVTLHEQQRGGS